MNMLIRIIIITVITGLVYFSEFFPDERLLSTLFTVASIFLSIGLSLIITFDFDKINNTAAYKNIKLNIKKVRDSFLKHFALIVVAYLVGLYFIQSGNSVGFVTKMTIYFPSLTIYRDGICQLISSLMFSTMLISNCYFIINFIEIQKLKDDISAQARASKRNNHR